MQSVKAAFPELYPNGSDDAVGGLKLKGAKAPNVRASPIDADMLMSNTDVPSAGAATNLRGVSAKPGRGVVVDLTDDDGNKRSQRSSFVTPTPIRNPDRRRTTSSASWGYANPVATDKDIEMLPPPAHVLNSYEYRDIPRPGETPEQTKERVAKMDFVKSIEGQFGKEKADQAAKLADDKRRQKKAGDSEQAGEARGQSTVRESEEAEEKAVDSEQTEAERMKSRWAEFEQKLKEMKPRGAFAGENGNRGDTSHGNGDRERGRSSATGRGGSGRLNVLNWDV